MYYTSNTPGLQVSLALPRFVCPVFAQVSALGRLAHVLRFALFSPQAKFFVCALPQALPATAFQSSSCPFQFLPARLFINRPLPQHKTPFLHVRKISTVNQIHQSVSPGFGPAPLLHPASALVRCFAHCFCPIAMLFSLSYSLYNKSLWQSHGKRLPFRPTLISIFCSFCALIQSVSSPVFFPLLFAASAPPATAHYTHLSRPLCFSFAGRLSSQTFLPLQRFAPASAAPTALPLPYYSFLPLPSRAYLLIVLLRAFSVFTCALGRFFDTKKSAVCAL